MEQPLSFWTHLIKKLFLNETNVTIRGFPSSEETERLNKEQESRISRRKKEFGTNGLKTFQKALEEAKQKNEVILFFLNQMICFWKKKLILEKIIYFLINKVILEIVNKYKKNIY